MGLFYGREGSFAFREAADPDRFFGRFFKELAYQLSRSTIMLAGLLLFSDLRKVASVDDVTPL